MQTATLFPSTALVATLLISVGVTVPPTTAGADDCLTAPNSAAPQGSHWYYRLDRATQRKCWYVRAPGQPAQQVAAPATTGPATLLHSTPAPSGTPSPHVAAAPSPQVKISAAKPNPTPVRSGTPDETVQQSAQEENTASTPEVPAPQTSTLSETNPQAAAPPAVIRPDASVAVAPVKAQEPIAVPTDARATSVSDDAESIARRADPANNPGMPIIIFPVLALGLVGVGVVIKIAAARGARIIIDQAEPDTVDDQRQHEWCDEHYRHGSGVEGQELHSLVSAVSQPGPLRDDDGAFQIAQKKSEREDKLLQFCQDIDRMLQSPPSPHQEPLRRRTAA